MDDSNVYIPLNLEKRRRLFSEGWCVEARIASTGRPKVASNSIGPLVAHKVFSASTEELMVVPIIFLSLDDDEETINLREVRPIGDFTVKLDERWCDYDKF
ncbi:hypothetical protein JHK85_000977 [Glycine max]|nr:hypothetical protein JHK85_000977 [Glycine max]